MNELFYFSFADLMVRVEYNEEANSLRYSSHRKLTFDERTIVEQYLLTAVAPKTDYYRLYPALFVYLGTEKQLANDLERFHLRNRRKTLAAREDDVKTKVEGLIAHAMQNYYFEQIGDMILAMRQQTRQGLGRQKLASFKRKMEELVKAYNFYSDKKITWGDVVPAELRSYFDGCPEAPIQAANLASREAYD